MKITASWAKVFEVFDPYYFMHSMYLVYTESIINQKIPFFTFSHALHWGRRFEYPWALQQAFPDDTMECRPPKRGRVLDAGGGNASFQFLLHEYYEQVYNIDYYPENTVKEMRNLAKTAGYPNMHFIKGDCLAPKYKDNYFEDVYCLSVLEHTDKDHHYAAVQLTPDVLIEEIEQLLRVTRRKLIITMDVMGESDKNGISIPTYVKLGEHYGFAVEKPSVSCMVLYLPTPVFIARMCFDKEVD